MTPDQQVHPHEHIYYVKRNRFWVTVGALVKMFAFVVGNGLKLLLLLIVFLTCTGAGRLIATMAVVGVLIWGFGPSYQLH